MKRWGQCILPLMILVLMCGDAYSRVNVFTSRLRARYLFRDRVIEPSKQIEGSEKTKNDTSDVVEGHNVRAIKFSPLFTAASSSASNNVEIRYNPSFTYDHELDKYDIDQDAVLKGHLQVNNNWSVHLNDQFILSDHQDIRLVEDNIQDELEVYSASEKEEDDNSDWFIHRRYWNNELSFLIRYRYFQYFEADLNYDYNVLTNEKTEDENDIYRDYKIHKGAFSLGYRFHQRWKITGSGQYTEGRYSTPDSTSTEEVGTESLSRLVTTDDENVNDDRVVFVRHTNGLLSIETDILPRNLFHLKYNYRKYDYESEEREDFIIQDVSGGWKKVFSKFFDLSLSGGSTLIATDDRGQAWEYNAKMEMNYHFGRGKFGLIFEKGYDKDMYSSLEEETLSDFYRLKCELTFSPIKNTFVILSGIYENENKETVALLDDGETVSDELNLDKAGDLTEYYEKKYTIGARVDYRFDLKYTVTVGLRYSDFDSEQEGEDYQESVAYLTLSRKTDLFHW